MVRSSSLKPFWCVDLISLFLLRGRAAANKGRCQTAPPTSRTYRAACSHSSSAKELKDQKLVSRDIRDSAGEQKGLTHSCTLDGLQGCDLG